MSTGTTRELKKQTYCILERFHDLEKAKKRSRIIQSQLNNTPAVLVVLNHLEDVFVNCLSSIPGAGGFLKTFRKYCATVRENLTSNRKLDDQHLAGLQKHHTEFFNHLIKNSTALDPACFSSATNNSLSQANWAAVSIWGNDVC